MPGADEPRKMKHEHKEWYYQSGWNTPGWYKRRSRELPKHNSLQNYLPVLETEDLHGNVPWPAAFERFPYINKTFLFQMKCTAEDLVKEVKRTEENFNHYLYNNRYQDACYIGTIMLYHFVLLLRPEDGVERTEFAIASFPKRITGKICYPEGDLLIIPRRKWSPEKGVLLGVCDALRYMEKVMKAVGLMPGSHIIPRQQFEESKPSHLRHEKPSLELLKRHRLPEPSEPHKIHLADPNLSSLSMFFKPLFTSKYIFLESQKTRYAVETLQLAFVVFQKLADTAMWSGEYAYALYLIQNMLIIVNYLEILLPVPILRRYYTFTTTYWYYGRVHFHLGLEQNPKKRFKEKYYEIHIAYHSWSTKFYTALEEEVQTNLSENFPDVDRKNIFVFPESKEKCLLRSFDGYLLVQIPTEWRRSSLQHNSVMFFSCHKLLLDWTDFLRSHDTKFRFKERKNLLVSVLKSLCYIQRTHLEDILQVTLGLLKAKCLYYLSILDVSQLVNWRKRDQSPSFPFDVSTFENINCSEYAVIVDDCEVDVADGLKPSASVVEEKEDEVEINVSHKSEEDEQETLPFLSCAHPVSPNLKDPLRSENTEAKSSVVPVKSSVDIVTVNSSQMFEARSDGLIYSISIVPVAVSNMLKANRFRLEGFEFMHTRKGQHFDFSNDLSVEMVSNIMNHYVHLQEYDPSLDVPWQMTRDFADVLDKWFPEKKNNKRFFGQPLSRVDYPMLKKIFAFIFMGGGLVFYFLYRLGGNRTFRDNARYFYAMMTLHVLKYDLWETVLKSLAEHAEMRKLVLLDCHDDLRRLPDRCVAVIRSYLHMLPLLYEMCIMKKTKGGPTKCPRLRVKDVAFPFNVCAAPKHNVERDVTLKILQRAKECLKKVHKFDQQGGIITALESGEGSDIKLTVETLQYSDCLKDHFAGTVPEYPVLERWSWKVPNCDSRPMCTGDDDCASAPCTVEEFIDEDERIGVSLNLVSEPNFLNELLTHKRDTSSSSTFPSTLSRLRKTLGEVVKMLLNYLDKFPKKMDKGIKPYVKVCIPGLSSAQKHQAVPNEKIKDRSLRSFLNVLKHVKCCLSDDGQPDDLALCKALLCLDKLFNQEFMISNLLRGSIAELDHFIYSE